MKIELRQKNLPSWSFKTIGILMKGAKLRITYINRFTESVEYNFESSMMQGIPVVTGCYRVFANRC